MRRIWTASILALTLLAWASCKERFDPRIDPAYSNFLVVEGFINADGASTFKLSRTVPLDDSTGGVKPENGAQVYVEGEDNSIYQVLNERFDGTYISDPAQLNRNLKYRLHINTTAGSTYLSEWVPVKVTPKIDSVSWELDSKNGVQVAINTHDPANNSRYYQWQYEETWEIHSAYESGFTYINGEVQKRNFNEIPLLYYCWQSNNSTEVLLGSTAQLTNDVVSKAPLVYIPKGSIKTSVRYSILVKQNAITREAYDFLQLMKKNTESLGSIFDPLPTELTGNITCATNPQEKVIGFVNASTLEQKRIFITDNDIGRSYYTRDCSVVLVANNKDSFSMYYDAGYLPFSITSDLSHYYSSYNTCIDCRLVGSNVKPSFW